MPTAQHMRSIARIERLSGSVLRLRDLEVGVRLVYPYLLTPLQLYVHDNPRSEFAFYLQLAGEISRDPRVGHGFVRLYYDRIEVPETDWEAKDRGEDVKAEVRQISLSASTTDRLTEICGKAHQENVNMLVRELAQSLRAAWFSDSSILEIKERVASELYGDPQMSTPTVDLFKEWVSSMLKDTTLRDPAGLEL